MPAKLETEFALSALPPAMRDQATAYLWRLLFEVRSFDPLTIAALLASVATRPGGRCGYLRR